MALSREELLVAIEENPEEFYDLIHRFIQGATYERDQHMRKMCFRVPVPFFNGVAVAHLTIENSDALVAQAITEMEATGMPWSWQIGPSSSPFDLATRLFNHRMQLSHDMPIMVANLNDFRPERLPANYKNVAVDDPDAYETWIEVAEVAFGLPRVVFDAMRKGQHGVGFANDAPIRNFVGYAGGEPVCTGTVFYGAGIPGIYTVGTPPQFRGKGYGRAVTEACMSDAKQRGYDTAFLQSSKMGYSVYQKIGFQEICKISIFVPSE